MSKPQSAPGASVERYSPELPYKPLVSPPSVEDKDACAIYASVRKDATPSHEPIELAIPAMQKMLHRAGNVDGEGDGCGLMLDLPRKIWAEQVRLGGHDPSLTLDDAFAVAHVFVERSQDQAQIQHDARELLNEGGFRVLAERIGVVNSPALGPTAREEEPVFWQLAGLVPDAARRDPILFELLIELEKRLGVHVPSFSATTCVYKVMGTPNVLGDYYPDLRDERFETIGCFGHNRYSTNTWPSFKRVQPFSVLGHNGEINTIEQLRQEAKMLAVPVRPGASDSQDLNLTIETLVSREGLSLAEAMEMILPPIVEEIRGLPEDLHGFYMYLHQAMGPFSQGPVALIARHADECVFSADAMGLRPLWQIETDADFVFSSEPGVVSVHSMASEPKPLAPGEKALVLIDRAERHSTLHPHDEMLRIVRDKWLRRNGISEVAGYERALATGGPLEGDDVPGYSEAGPEEPVKVEDRILAGFGWQRDDVKLVQQMASNGAEPVGSLGYDGPLAALSPERQNLADYFKETVAVVTNPALDRERELEHFSTRALFGRRPSLDHAGEDTGTIETEFPVILGGHHGLAPLSDRTYRQIARDRHTYLLEDLWEEFRGRAAAADISLLESETTAGAIERIKQEAVKKVRDGAELVILTDRTVYDAERRYLDPHLATSAVDQALKQFKVERGEENLRRRCGLVLRSAAIRNVHDVMLALGLGANGVCPYTMVEVICVEDYETDVGNLCAALRKGIEKVISTIGIHEVRGYARQFSSIGVKPELAEIFQTEAFAASAKGGTGFADLDEDTNERARALSGDDEAAKPAKTFRFYPKVYKAAIATANGTGTYEEYSEKVRDLEKQSPISMRHVMALRGDREPLADASVVDAGIGHHDYPIVISSMSFGSQSEPAFRAYAEAAKATNILCVNGEGGEIRDMYGHYRKWRGQQVASGRFGVSAEMLNSSYLAEIKIGQGAKPGEGGHLPGKKVSAKVAAARNAAPGPDLALQQPRPLLDRGPRRADRRAEDGQPRRPRLGQGPGGAEHRHDRARDRQGGRRHHHPLGLRGGHRGGAPARAAPRRPALGHRHPCRSPGADGGRAAQPGRDLGRRRLPHRPRHRQIALPRRQPGRLRHPGDGQHRLHDLPWLPARHLSRRHRHPDRDRGAGPGARVEEVHAAGGRPRRRKLRPLLHRDGRGGQRGGRLARLRPRPGPGRPLRPAAPGRGQGQARPGAADHAAGGVPRPRADRPAGGRGAGRGSRRSRPRRRPADPDGGQAGLQRDRRAGARSLLRPHRPQRVPAGDRRQRPRARDRAGGGDRPLPRLRRRTRLDR
jgi:glutamate synthase (NADPH/NADH) large chain